MGFFRVRGGSISLLHGVRDQDMGVRHIRLHTFSGLEELQAVLDQDEWHRLQLRIEQKYPDFRLDWPTLHEQARSLCTRKSRPPNLEEQIQATRKAAQKLIKSFYVVPSSQDLFLKAVGPQLVEVIRHATTQYAKLGSLDEGLTELLLRQLLPDPEVTESLVDEGREAFYDGRTAVAKKRFAAARAHDPCDPDVLNSEAVQWMERKKYDKAEPLLLEARQMAYYQLPNPRKSYSWYQHEVRPYIRATYNLALVRQQQSRWEEALELCQECLARCPNDGIGARYLLGPILQGAGRLREAAEEHRKACQGGLIDPPDPYFDLCNVELQLGRTVVAVEALCEGLAINRHVPKYLLKKPPRGPLPSHVSADSEECAMCYGRERKSTWPASSLKVLRALWKDPTLVETCKALETYEQRLSKERPGGQRSSLLRQIEEFKESRLGRPAARALHRRVLG